MATCIALSGCDKGADASIAAAKARLAKDDLVAALIELKNAVQAEPDRAEARFLLGKALLDNGEAVAAAVELNRAAALGTSTEQVQPVLAKALLESREFSKVIDLERTGQVALPDAVASVRSSAAIAHAALGNDAEAQQSIAAALQAKADHPAALLLRARTLAAGKELDAAATIVDQVIARAPANADALTLRGDLLQAGKNDLDGAASLYRRALQADRRHLDAHVALLTLLLNKNDLDGARAQLEMLRQARPGHFQARYFEARLAVQAGDFKLADERLKALLKSAPRNARVQQLAAVVALQRGEVLQAERLLRSVIQQSEDAQVARQLLARALVASGRPTDALTALEPLFSSGRPDAQTLLLAGTANLLAGNIKRAEAQLQLAAKLAPNEAESRTLLAVARISRGDTAAGVLELEAIAGSEEGTGADMALIGAHVRQRQFDAALKAIDRLDGKAPGKPLAPYLRAQVQVAKGDLAAARGHFEKALAADPNFFAATEGLAAIDLSEKKADQARARYAAALKADPDNARARAAVASLDERSGKPKHEVAAELQQAVALKPGDSALRRRLINHYMARQDYKLALDAAQAAVGALPDDADLLALLAVAHLAAGEANQAVSTYNRLIMLRPKSPEMLVGLAEAQFAATNYRAAEEAAKRALSLAPDSVAAMQTAVKVDIQAGRHEEALAKARALQKRNPGKPQGWIFEGDVQFARGDWAAAVAVYRTALQKQDASTIAQRLHVALRSAGDKSKTEAFATEWMQKHPKDQAFLNYLASWAIVDKELDRGAALLEQGLSITPDSAAMLNNLAWVQATLKRPGSIATAERANRLSPNQPVYLDTWAYALAAEGQHSRAIEVQKQALGLAPAGHGLRLNLARLYVQAGDKAAARDELASLAQLGTGFTGHAEVARLQAEVGGGPRSDATTALASRRPAASPPSAAASVLATAARVLWIVVGLGIPVILLIAAWRPPLLRVERTIVVDAPPQRVFDMLQDFRCWENWSASKPFDPSFTRSFTGSPVGTGAVCRWQDARQQAEGYLEIMHASAPGTLVVESNQTRPKEARLLNEFGLTATNTEGTTVTWVQQRPALFAARVVGVVLGQDRRIGKELAAGLSRLKAAAEGAPAEQPALADAGSPAAA